MADEKPSEQLLEAPSDGDDGLLSTPRGGGADTTRTELPAAILKADTTNLAIAGERDGKLRVRSSSWEDARIVQPGRQLVIRNVHGQAHVFDVAQGLRSPHAA